MIQSDSLTHLTFNLNAFDWSSYDKLPFDHEGPIPEDRPLLFARTPEKGLIHEYWFLHWQEGVTKCVANKGSRTLEVFKCEPCDLPLALRKEEDVMNDLKEVFNLFSDQFSCFRCVLEFPVFSSIFTRSQKVSQCSIHHSNTLFQPNVLSTSKLLKKASGDSVKTMIWRAIVGRTAMSLGQLLLECAPCGLVIERCLNTCSGNF